MKKIILKDYKELKKILPERIAFWIVYHIFNNKCENCKYWNGLHIFSNGIKSCLNEQREGTLHRYRYWYLHDGQEWCSEFKKR